MLEMECVPADRQLRDELEWEWKWLKKRQHEVMVGNWAFAHGSGEDYNK